MPLWLLWGHGRKADPGTWLFWPWVWQRPALMTKLLLQCLATQQQASCCPGSERDLEFRELPCGLVGVFLFYIFLLLYIIYTDSLFSGSLVLVDLHVVLLHSVFVMSFWNLLLAAVAWSSFWPSFSLQRSCQLHGLIRWDSQVMCISRAGYKM